MGNGHYPTEWPVLKLELSAQEDRTSMHIPLELRFDHFEMGSPWRGAHGGDKHRSSPFFCRTPLRLSEAMGLRFRFGRMSILMACTCSYDLPEHNVKVSRHFISRLMVDDHWEKKKFSKLFFFVSSDHSCFYFKPETKCHSKKSTLTSRPTSILLMS
jgi:hypothetical protein